MGESSSLYSRVLEITEDYLGPASQRFLDRLVMNHLGKPAPKISRKDLPQLVVWIKLATTMITSDQRSVDEYMQRLEDLVDTHSDHLQKSKSKAIA
jgi:hypothetical protein